MLNDSYELNHLLVLTVSFLLFIASLYSKRLVGDNIMILSFIASLYSKRLVGDNIMIKPENHYDV